MKGTEVLANPPPAFEGLNLVLTKMWPQAQSLRLSSVANATIWACVYTYTPIYRLIVWCALSRIVKTRLVVPD